MFFLPLPPPDTKLEYLEGRLRGHLSNLPPTTLRKDTLIEECAPQNQVEASCCQKDFSTLPCFVWFLVVYTKQGFGRHGVCKQQRAA